MKRLLLLFLCVAAASFVAQAQSKAGLLKAADEYYSRGDFKNAAIEYELLKEKCAENDDYGGYKSKLNECYRRLNAADESRIKAEEDAAFNNCTTEEACRWYLKNYPRGRYYSQVEDKLSKFVKDRLAKEEYEAFLTCTTESACEYYLRVYPNGKYYSQVLQKKHELESERFQSEMEAEKTAYMDIQEIQFANMASDGSFINSFGSVLFSSDLKYLRPQVVYNGILSQTKYVDLYYKIVYPNGSVETSPSESFPIVPGKGQSFELMAKGSKKGGTFAPGNYGFELWYKGSQIWQTWLEIMDKGNALSRGNWRAALKKCYYYGTTTLDGGSYKGQLRDGNLFGLGLLSWNDGSFYIGSWRFGTKDGLGLYIASPGSMVRNCPNCTYFVGEFSFDEKTGKGTCYDNAGKLLYYGTFEDGVPTQNYPMTGLDTYKFQCMEFANGDYYVGETKSGKQHGTGMYISSGGDLWFGNWTDGKRDSYGITMSYQGGVSTGTWVNGVKQ